LHRFTYNTARGRNSGLFDPQLDTTITTPHHHESHTHGTVLPECD